MNRGSFPPLRPEGEGRPGCNGVNFAGRAAEWWLDLLFPKCCAGCGSEGSFCCPACRGRLAARAPACPVCGKRNLSGVLCASCSDKAALRGFLAPFSYRDPLIRELIHTYKYDRARELSAFFASELVGFFNLYAIRLPRSAILVPVPLHRRRERERGFNQASLLALELGARLGLLVKPLLKRARRTRPQVEMADHAARRKNMAGAFRVSDHEAAAGASVVLVDDVATSGATLSEAARVLREAGAYTVWAIVIAKG